jgi:5S rRNA maturation endonuclease (ribonuclease M5)
MKNLIPLISETAATEKIDYQALNEKIADNITIILDSFGLPYKNYPNRVAFECPVHDSSNKESANIFTKGNKTYGNFKCWTNNCHDEIGYGAINFVKFLIEKHTGSTLRLSEVGLYLQDKAKIKLPKISIEGVSNKKFSSFVLNENKVFNKVIASRESLLKKIIIPSPYFINRGFSEGVLTAFDVGYCRTHGKEMFMRSVVPVYNNMEQVIGCLGRSQFEECGICGRYHSPVRRCPSNKLEEKWSRKWINSEGFKTGLTLYSLWNLPEDIKKVILVEGPADVWRLWEGGIKNAVALFGCNLLDEQVRLLDALGITDIYMSLDNDDAGRSGEKSIIEKYSLFYNLHKIHYSYKDVGSIPVELIPEIFREAN